MAKNHEVQPLPNELLGLPLPDGRQFATDPQGVPRPDTLGQAFALTAEVAGAFGASRKTVNTIYKLRDQAQRYLPYAPLGGAILEGAYRGEETIAPEHVAPLLNAQHYTLPWQARDTLEKYDMRLGSTTPTLFVLGGLNAALAHSPRVKEIFTEKVKPKLDTARPYIERYATFESGPKQQLQDEVRQLLDLTYARARTATNNRHDRAVVGDSLKQTTLELLQGQLDLPMLSAIIKDALGLAKKDAATTIKKINDIDPKAWPVAAHRVIVALNCTLPKERRHAELEELTKGFPGLAMVGNLSKKFRALGKLPAIMSTAVRYLPTTNEQLTYPLEVMNALTDPERRTLTAGRSVGSLALAA